MLRRGPELIRVTGPRRGTRWQLRRIRWMIRASFEGRITVHSIRVAASVTVGLHQLFYLLMYFIMTTQLTTMHGSVMQPGDILVQLSFQLFHRLQLYYQLPKSLRLPVSKGLTTCLNPAVLTGQQWSAAASQR